MSAAAVQAARRPLATRRRLLSPGWPVYFFFVSLPIAWLFGLANIVLPLYGVLMLLGLLLRHSVRVPPRFGIWLLFLTWVAASAIEIDSGSRAVAYAYRGSLYLTATVLLVYIFSSPERAVPTRLVVKALTIYWAVAVIGGLLGVAFANVTLPSFAHFVFSRVLPPSLTEVGFFHDITTPGFAEVQRILGFPVGRPKTFFNYTNEWGSTVVLLTPFAIIAMGMFGRFWRRVIEALLLLSLIPLVFSLNRAAWIALIVLVAYAAVRFAAAGDYRAVRAILAIVAVTVVVTLATPLGGLIVSRLHHGHSDEGRQTRDLAAVGLVQHSPVFGYGAPQPTSDDPTAPAVGTHGQLFLLLVSQGIPGLVFFLGWLVYSFVRTAPRGSPLVFWCHVVILLFLVQMPFYELTAFQLMVLAAALGLAWREIVSSGAEGDRARRGPPAWLSAALAPVTGSSGRSSTAPAWLGGLRARAGVQPERRARQGASAEADRTARVHTSDLSNVARGGALGIAGGIGFGVFGFVLLLVVSHGLGATLAGIFFEAVALFMIFARISQIGADVGMVRAVSRLVALGRQYDIPHTLVTGVVPVAAASALLGGCLFAFAPTIADLAVNGSAPESLVSYIRIFAPFLVLAALTGVLVSAARGLGALAPFVWIENLGKPALQPLFILIVLALGFGTAAVALAWALPVALGFAAAISWLAILVARTVPAGVLAERRWTSVSVFTDFWAFAFPRAIAALFQAVVAWIDVILVGALASARSAGIYAVASRLTLLGALFLRALILVLGPQVSSFLARGERARAQVVYQVSTWWLTAISWPAYVSIALFAPVVIRIFGHGFASGSTALAILSLAMLISMACGPVSVVLLMAGKSSWNLANTIFAATLAIGLDVVLIPRYGVVGAAVGATAGIAANNLVPLVQVWRYLDLHPLGTGFAIVASSVAVTYGLIGLAGRLLLGATPLALVLSVALATLAYIFLLHRERETLRLSVIRDVARVGRRGRAMHPDAPV